MATIMTIGVKLRRSLTSRETCVNLAFAARGQLGGGT
jgi:hypothetical protein